MPTISFPWSILTALLLALPVVAVPHARLASPAVADTGLAAPGDSAVECRREPTPDGGSCLVIVRDGQIEVVRFSGCPSAGTELPALSADGMRITFPMARRTASGVQVGTGVIDWSPETGWSDASLQSPGDVAR